MVLDELKDKKIVWILGGPGSGRGTQAAKLAEKFNYAIISTREVLRAEVNSGSELGNDIKHLMERGELVPSDAVLELIKKEMLKNLDKPGYFLAGFPQETEQGELFEEHIGQPTSIIYYEVADENLLYRSLERGRTHGRADDNEITVKARINTFHRFHGPVLRKYASKIVTVDGDRDEDAIFNESVEVVEKAMK